MCGATGLVLAVDCGSTNLKGALFDRAGKRLAEASMPVVYTREHGGMVEFSAEAIWDAFVQVVHDVCAAARTSAAAISALAFDSQAQTFALFDRYGRSLTPFYSWLDRRAEDEAEVVRRRLGEHFHQHCSLAPPIAQLQLCKMLWVTRHVDLPGADRPVLALLPSFLSWRLGAGNVTDRNLAAMGGAYSLQHGGWWSEALALCDMHSSDMPELVDVGDSVLVKDERPDSPFELGTRVVLAGNDQTAGAYGNGCELGGMVVTLGTALVVYRFAGTQPGPYHKGTFWGPYPGGAFYELSTIDEGCYALDWARKRMLPDATAKAFDELASQTIEQGSVDAAPFFFPARIHEGNPWQGDADASARAYAVLEGIAFELRRLIETSMDAQGDSEWISVTGGGSSSTVWMQLIADVLQCPLRRGQGDPLLGAAAMAMDGAGRSFDSAETAVMPRDEQVPVLRRRYEVWCEQR